MSESPDATTRALEAGLRTYFAAQSGEPPHPEEFWQRLAPHLGPRTPPAAAVAKHSDPSRMDERYPKSPLVNDHPRLQAYRYAGHSDRLRRWLSTTASLVAVVLICLAAVALFSRFAPQDRTGKAIKSGQLVWRQVTLPPGVVLRDGTGVTEHGPESPRR
jgi:hypothetical protein